MSESNDSWLIVGGSADPLLQQRCEQAVAEKIAAGKYKQGDIDYLRRIDLSPVKGALQISDSQLEKLRRLCQLAEVELVPARISSHRPIVGSLIVAAKKVLFSVLKVLMKDTLRKQRDFNAAVISFLAESAKLDK